jgi:hypothetical protein
MRSAPPVPFKFMAMGTIPLTDPDFLRWKEMQEEGLTMVTAMARYMPHINAYRRETFEEEWAEHQAFLEFNRLESIRKTTEQQSELDSLKVRISEQQGKNEALVPSLILNHQIIPQSIPSLQINPDQPEHTEHQSNPSPFSPEHSQSQSNSPPPLPEHSLPTGNLPASSLSTPQNDPFSQAEHVSTPPRTERALGAGSMEGNNLTMQQAIELFELLQERRARGTHSLGMVEAQPIVQVATEAEPLSFLTLASVEGIIGSTEAHVGSALERSTWNDKVDKFMRLSAAYSSDRTVSGERCYMIDCALFKDLLLAVSARKQNEHLMSAAAEKLEQQIGKIMSSQDRITQREKEFLESFNQDMNARQERYRLAHKVRMERVLDEFKLFKDSVISSAEQNLGINEVQQLRFQVEQYENVLPVYASKLKDFEEQNKRLIEEKLGLSRDIEQMKERLSSAEAVVFSLGTPEAIRKRTPGIEHIPRPEIPSIPVTDRLRNGSSSKDAPDTPMSTPEMVDLSDSPPEPASNQSEPVSKQPEPASKRPI